MLLVCDEIPYMDTGMQNRQVEEGGYATRVVRLWKLKPWEFCLPRR